MYGSLNFSNRLFILIDLLGIPLFWGKCGLLVMCLNPYNSANSCISRQAYCGPLSLTRVAGTPYLEKMAFSAGITILELIEDSFWISMKHEK